MTSDPRCACLFLVSGLGLWLAIAGPAAAQRVMDVIPAAVSDARFDPPVTNGLVLHLAADAIGGLADGDKTAQWDDLSGEGNHATQKTEANRPVYKTGILDGKPVVRFDGANHYLGSTTLGDFGKNAYGRFTTFIVFSTTNSIDDMRPFSVINDGLKTFLPGFSFNWNTAGVLNFDARDEAGKRMWFQSAGLTTPFDGNGHIITHRPDFANNLQEGWLDGASISLTAEYIPAESMEERTTG